MKIPDFKHDREHVTQKILKKEQDAKDEELESGGVGGCGSSISDNSVPK